MTESLPPIFDRNNPLADRDVRKRVEKLTGNDPERMKLTNIIIQGESARELDDLLSVNAWNVKHVKLYSGLVRVRGDIDELLAVAKGHNVDFYLGGGVLEELSGSQLAARAAKLQDMGIRTVEISDSYDRLSERGFRSTLRKVRKDFDTVLAEIGTKKDEEIPFEQWSRSLDIALEEESDGVILEGTGAGDKGIYHDSTAPKTFVVSGLYKQARERGNHEGKLIVEAPDAQQQRHWMSYGGLGWDVKLANVKPDSTSLLVLADDRIGVSSDRHLRETVLIRSRLEEVFDLIIQEGKRGKTSADRMLNDEKLAAVDFTDRGQYEAYKEYVKYLSEHGVRSRRRETMLLNLADILGGRNPFE